MKHLRALQPEAVDLDLGELLQSNRGKLAKRIEGARLIVVRSQSVDALGELDSGLLARQTMDTMVGNLARAVRKLAGHGVESFVVTADHGHLFAAARDESMVMDSPGGEQLELHRRCWAGRGGQTPAGCVRASGHDLGYATDLDFVFPTNLAVFRSGGNLGYHHGGTSLQELVIPVLSLKLPARAEASAREARSRLSFEGCPTVLCNRTFGLKVRTSAELFATDALSVRLVLLAREQEVGKAGMCPDADFDRKRGVLSLGPGQVANVGMMLTDASATQVRLVALDPQTDAVLAQSGEIEVKLGI
jgi:hypothetical protein